MSYFAHSSLEFDVELFDFAMELRVLLKEQFEENGVMSLLLIGLGGDLQGLPVELEEFAEFLDFFLEELVLLPEKIHQFVCHYQLSF